MLNQCIISNYATIPSNDTLLLWDDLYGSNDNVELEDNCIKIKKDGLYSINLSIIWYYNPIGHRKVYIIQNNFSEINYVDKREASTEGNTINNISFIQYFKKDDTIDVIVSQNSGTDCYIIGREYQNVDPYQLLDHQFQCQSKLSITKI